MGQSFPEVTAQMKDALPSGSVRIRNLVFTSLMAAVIAVCAWLQIPYGEINFTLQTLGVFCAVGLLGGRLGTISVVIYLLMGAFGAPVFTNFTGGFAKLAGPTGGYLIGFIFAALTYWGITKLFGDSLFPAALGMILGNLVCYAFGTVWFMYAASSKPGLISALSLCVIPYVLPDLFKIVLALALTSLLRKRLRAEGILL